DASSHARQAASAASSTKSSRRPGRHVGGSTVIAAGEPGRDGGYGTAGIGANGTGVRNAVLASTPSSPADWLSPAHAPASALPPAAGGRPGSAPAPGAVPRRRARI